MRHWRFRPGWIPSLAAIVYVALTSAAGQWQTRRAVEKERRAVLMAERSAEKPAALESAVVDVRSVEWRRVRAQGEYVADKAILLDNRVLRGRVGYEVLVPLRIAGSDMHVMVNRGWVAAGPVRAELPRVATPSGPQIVEGIATLPPSRVFELGDGDSGPLWQHFLLERYRVWSGLELQPILVLQTNSTSDGLIREWPAPDLGVEKNRGYALQWYTFAALTVVLYVALNLKRRAPAL